MLHIKNKKGSGWLLIFYSVPSSPVNNRVRIWRRLAKAGAVHLKGAVSMLPFSDEAYEFCQWLVSEVTSMHGEGAFVKADKIEMMKEEEIIALFVQQREKDHHLIEKKLGEIERKLDSIRKGSGVQNNKVLSHSFNKLLREFEEVRKIDFFSSRAGAALEKKFKELEADIRGLSVASSIKQKFTVVPRRIEDYQGRRWITRKKPFVDRMASAWLIRKFIDKKAAFRFIDEQDLEGLEDKSATFDIRGGEFTHIADMCTFEVLLKSFGFKNKPLQKIAAIVHELDIKDEKQKNSESSGIEEILIGIRKTAQNDEEALEKGVAVFEMLYASKT